MIEPETAEILGNELRGRTALRRKGRIGRDRLNAQEREQPLEAVVELGIDPLENGRKRLS